MPNLDRYQIIADNYLGEEVVLATVNSLEEALNRIERERAVAVKEGLTNVRSKLEPRTEKSPYSLLSDAIMKGQIYDPEATIRKQVKVFSPDEIQELISNCQIEIQRQLRIIDIGVNELVKRSTHA